MIKKTVVTFKTSPTQLNRYGMKIKKTKYLGFNE